LLTLSARAADLVAVVVTVVLMVVLVVMSSPGHLLLGTRFAARSGGPLQENPLRRRRPMGQGAEAR
jgi:hypothetical protein